MAKPLTTFQALILLGRRFAGEQMEGVSAYEARAMGAHVCSHCGKFDRAEVQEFLLQTFNGLAARLPEDFPADVIKMMGRCARLGVPMAVPEILSRFLEVDGEHPPPMRTWLLQAYRRILDLLKADFAKDGIDVLALQQAFLD